jgi:hypothetical protein
LRLEIHNLLTWSRTKKNGLTSGESTVVPIHKKGKVIKWL